jgi:hypothetical protein
MCSPRVPQRGEEANARSHYLFELMQRSMRGFPTLQSRFGLFDDSRIGDN